MRYPSLPWHAVLLVLALGIDGGCGRTPTPAAPSPPTPAAPSRAAGLVGGPVVILITAANLRADVVDFADPQGLTPRMAAAARDAAYAGPALAASSAELPALASLLSGLLPSSHGVWSWEFDTPAPTSAWLPEVLNVQGVTASAWVGRPGIESAGSWGRGFREWRQLARLRSVRAALLEPPAGPSFTWIDLSGARPPWLLAEHAVPVEPPPDRLPLRLGPEELTGWASGEQRFGVVARRRVDALYRHAVARADVEIGELLDAALASPRAAETYVFVTSDCGYRLGEANTFGTAQGLSRIDVAVPLLILAPQPLGLGADLEPSLLRLAPTISELFGAGSSSAWESPLRAGRRIGLSELPVSNGFRLASATSLGLQLVRSEQWGTERDPSTLRGPSPYGSTLHGDSLRDTEEHLLLESVPWLSVSERLLRWGATPGDPSAEATAASATDAGLRDELSAALAGVTNPEGGRVTDLRQRSGIPSRAILQAAPVPGASGP